MQKTQAEIKKALEICTTKQRCSGDCPYFSECAKSRYSTKLDVDALMYIERLEANIAAYRGTIKQLEDENKRLIKAIRRADKQHYDSAAGQKREEEAPIVDGYKRFSAGGGSGEGHDTRQSF